MHCRFPGPHPRGKFRLIWTGGCLLEGVPAPRGCLLQGGVETPHDGYYCGWYTSYWNAFFLAMYFCSYVVRLCNIPEPLDYLKHQTISMCKLITACNEVGARLCFYTYLWFCLQGGVWYPSMHCRWYPSMPCSRSPGGHIPTCLAGFQAHTQGGSWGVWPGGSLGPHPKGKLKGLAWGVSRPTPRGLQAQT